MAFVRKLYGNKFIWASSEPHKIYCREFSVSKKRLAKMGNPFFTTIRSSPTELFFEKGVLKICNKITVEHPCRSVTSIKLLCLDVLL